MRKIQGASILLVCILFCLAACGSRDNNKNKQSVENNISNDGHPVSNVTDNDMESYTYELSDDDRQSENQTFQGVTTAAYTDAGFYANNYNDDKNHIYFVDKKSRRAEVLCYVPGCHHDMYSCNARYVDFKGLYVSGSHLYVISSYAEGDDDDKNVYLYRMNLD